MGLFITSDHSACALDNMAYDNMNDSNFWQHNNAVLRNKPGGHSTHHGSNNVDGHNIHKPDNYLPQLPCGADNDNQKMPQLRYFAL
ncbi:hypothetical protein [Mucilaginibacter flavus]|uniref:hypothetical protein n=1 Tax=Mucilaginibacter flavus TaxID=931504 RepID=UPI0025B3CBE4|nr:hypothetical protein [Mucilaginibacter flavus]MDN3583379.1 hypothetical protein [Mucilaginibacter flavus]